MRKSIREFLEAKLRALELSHAAGADDRDLPGRIILWPPPKNGVEAKLHGLLEGLYTAGKINGDEAADWARRFRSVLAAPGDQGTVSLRIGGSIPAELGTLNEPWPQESMIASIEPTSHHVTTTPGRSRLLVSRCTHQAYVFTGDLIYR